MKSYSIKSNIFKLMANKRRKIFPFFFSFIYLWAHVMTVYYSILMIFRMKWNGPNIRPKNTVQTFEYVFVPLFSCSSLLFFFFSCFFTFFVVAYFLCCFGCGKSSVFTIFCYSCFLIEADEGANVRLSKYAFFVVCLFVCSVICREIPFSLSYSFFFFFLFLIDRPSDHQTQSGTYVEQSYLLLLLWPLFALWNEFSLVWAIFYCVMHICVFWICVFFYFFSAFFRVFVCCCGQHFYWMSVNSIHRFFFYSIFFSIYVYIVFSSQSPFIPVWAPHRFTPNCWYSNGAYFFS